MKTSEGWWRWIGARMGFDTLVDFSAASQQAQELMISETDIWYVDMNGNFFGPTMEDETKKEIRQYKVNDPSGKPVRLAKVCQNFFALSTNGEAFFLLKTVTKTGETTFTTGDIELFHPFAPILEIFCDKNDFFDEKITKFRDKNGLHTMGNNPFNHLVCQFIFKFNSIHSIHRKNFRDTKRKERLEMLPFILLEKQFLTLTLVPLIALSWQRIIYPRKNHFMSLEIMTWTNLDTQVRHQILII